MSSPTPTPYAIICYGHWDLPGYGCGKVFLTKEEYNKQMAIPSKTWRCPNCRYEADFDNDNYESFLEKEDAQNKAHS